MSPRKFKVGGISPRKFKVGGISPRGRVSRGIVPRRRIFEKVRGGHSRTFPVADSRGLSSLFSAAEVPPIRGGSAAEQICSAQVRRVRGGFRGGLFYSASKMNLADLVGRLGPTRTYADPGGVRRGIVPPLRLPTFVNFCEFFKNFFQIHNKILHKSSQKFTKCHHWNPPGNTPQSKYGFYNL